MIYGDITDLLLSPNGFFDAVSVLLATSMLFRQLNEFLSPLLIGLSSFTAVDSQLVGGDWNVFLIFVGFLADPW